MYGRLSINNKDSSMKEVFSQYSILDEEKSAASNVLPTMKISLQTIKHFSTLELESFQRQLLKKQQMNMTDLYKFIASQYALAERNNNILAKDAALYRFENALGLSETIERSHIMLNDVLDQLAKTNFLYKLGMQVFEQIEAEYIKIFLQNNQTKQAQLSQCIGAVLQILEGTVYVQREGRYPESIMGDPAQILTHSAHHFSGTPNRCKQTLGALFIGVAACALLLGIIAVVASTTNIVGLALGCIGVGIIGGLCMISGGVTVYKNRSHGLFSSFQTISNKIHEHNIIPSPSSFC